MGTVSDFCQPEAPVLLQSPPDVPCPHVPYLDEQHKGEGEEVTCLWVARI